MMNEEEKYIYVMELFAYTDDLLVDKFFDIDSVKMLDQKIEVLEALRDGMKPQDIKNYYKVLELYPEKGEMWD